MRLPARLLVLAAMATFPLETIPQVAAQASRGALAKGTFAITEVTVVPMTSDTILSGSTVLVRDGRVAAVGPSGSVKVPKEARRIDGKGRYLIPGLADMHTHLYSDDEVPDSVAPYELGVMVANGITTARLMIGTPEHLVLRRELIDGRIVGPQLWVASPQFTGEEGTNARVVTEPDDARAAVRQMRAAGYDFIKLTTEISPPVYDAIVDEGRRGGIRIIGHVDPRVGVRRALAARQQIEHLDNYLETVLADSAPVKHSVSNYGLFKPAYWESLDYVDDAKVQEIAEATAKAGVWSTPTLAIFNTAFAKGETDEAMRSRPDWAMIPPKVRALYLGARTKYWKTAATEARRKRYIDTRNRITRLIAENGGKLLAGSDTPEWLMAYGWTLHRELEHFVEAGLTPYQALLTATRNPAEFLEATKEWGTVEPGKRADLVLVSANPLEDIRNTARIEGVAMGGRWLARPDLDRMIAVASQRLDGAPPEPGGR